jgi:hypothetical protein
MAHTALAVNPHRPADPSVVTTFTAAPKRAMAFLKSCLLAVMCGTSGSRTPSAEAAPGCCVSLDASHEPPRRRA